MTGLYTQGGRGGVHSVPDGDLSVSNFQPQAMSLGWSRQEG